MSSAACPLCGAASDGATLSEAGWLDGASAARLAGAHSGWTPADGACPACVQQALLETLLEKGESAFHDSVQRVWPLDAEAAFGALPTPLRLHADPRFTGRGVTVALVDAGFFPHDDLVRPRNRIRAWADATLAPVAVHRFAPGDTPRWPRWDARTAGQWHGLMTSAAAAGNGALSHGLYRGIAPEAELVLVHVADETGRLGNQAIARALRWLGVHANGFGLRVVSLSLGGDPVEPLAGNPVDEAVSALVRQGVSVVVAAGNDGERRLVPPGTAPDALTIGGLDDRNTLDHAARLLWHSSYGETADGVLKPELVAPSLRVVAPLLPGTEEAREAGMLFADRAAGAEQVEARLAALKLVTPHYQHVEGTSFAAPLVAGVVACMLEANPTLTPLRIRELLIAAAHAVPGASPERQGAGALDAGRALTLALADRVVPSDAVTRSPVSDENSVRLLLHGRTASEVRVVGSWDGWQQPGTPARRVTDALWEVRLAGLAPGTYAYKFVADDAWLTDPANPSRMHDGHGGFNSVLRIT